MTALNGSARHGKTEQIMNVTEARAVTRHISHVAEVENRDRWGRAIDEVFDRAREARLVEAGE
jgi:hypothetical protein